LKKLLNTESTFSKTDLEIFQKFDVFQFKNSIDIGVSVAYDMEVDMNHNYF